MSSAASTDAVQGPTEAGPRSDVPATPTRDRLQPWQLFVLAALACATAATFIARGQGVGVVVLLSVLMGVTALVALAALRTVLPLVTSAGDRTSMIGDRTRAALERDKLLTLRAIKELEFDRAMGKVSDEDFREMSVRLRSKAGRLMRQLEAGGGYRERIEKDLAKRLGETTAAAAPPACEKCGTVNEADARFCKRCGVPLGA